MRRASWILGSVSILLVATGAVSKFAVYPALHQMPEDAEGEMHFRGTLTALDPAAVQKGDFANAVIRDLPVTADRKVRAVHTSGATIVLNDTTLVFGPTMQVVTKSEHQYAVHRRNLLERPVPRGATAERHVGLSAGFPLTPEKRDYPFWDSETQTTVPAAYAGSEERAGRTVYAYRITAAGPLADKAVTEALPPALPRPALQALNPTLPLDGQPDMVPLSYLSTTNMTGYVDAETGVTIGLESTKAIVATVNGAEAFPVAKAQLTSTKDSERDLADTAATGALVFWLLSDAVPFGAWALAVVLLALAFWLERRRRLAIASGVPMPGPRTGEAPDPADDPADAGDAEERGDAEVSAREQQA